MFTPSSTASSVPGPLASGQQHQHGRQIVDEVRQDGGHRADPESQGRQPLLAAAVARRGGQAVVHDCLDHHPEAADQHRRAGRRSERARRRPAPLPESARPGPPHRPARPRPVTGPRPTCGETDQRQPHHCHSEHRPLRGPRPLGPRRPGKIAAEHRPEHHVLGRHGRQPGRAISPLNRTKDSPADAEGQQVGQVRHRQQQRGRVRQMRGGVEMRLGTALEFARRRREHHRSQQHDRGIEARSAVSRPRSRRRLTEQPALAPRRSARHPGSGSPRTGPRGRTGSRAPGRRPGRRRREACGPSRRSPGPASPHRSPRCPPPEPPAPPRATRPGARWRRPGPPPAGPAR